eukprot:SAG31_NODE_3798_length_3873_cov_6.539746_2_plen_153_part_00
MLKFYFNFGWGGLLKYFTHLAVRTGSFAYLASRTAMNSSLEIVFPSSRSNCATRPHAPRPLALETARVRSIRRYAQKIPLSEDGPPACHIWPPVLQNRSRLREHCGLQYNFSTRSFSNEAQQINLSHHCYRHHRRRKPRPQLPYPQHYLSNA